MGEMEPLRRVVDLDVGEQVEVTLADGATARVKLLGTRVRRDSLCDGVRQCWADLEVNGEPVTVESNNYRLPVAAAGARVDCPITHDYYTTAHGDAWALRRAARIRLWPADGPLMPPGSFIYPVRQRWLASFTQMGNEPVYVDGGDLPGPRKIYYHNGLDIGGPDAVVPVRSATDGVVVVRATEVLDESDLREYGRYDRVCVRDRQGWYYRYSHLDQIADNVVLGQPIRQGDPIGILGKEGSSGGWAHLHFEVRARQPSGLYATEEGYPFLWEACLAEHRPEVIAVARPHHLLRVGEQAALDASRSWSAAGPIARYEWRFSDGTTAAGERVTRRYDTPGMWCETVAVTDPAGHVAYDFAVVQVLDADSPRGTPSIHAGYWPTLGLRAGEEVTFQVRSFRTERGGEVWDFGDGSPTVEVASDGNADRHNPDGYARCTHVYRQPGDYLATVTHTTDAGVTATARLHVPVASR